MECFDIRFGFEPTSFGIGARATDLVGVIAPETTAAIAAGEDDVTIEGVFRGAEGFEGTLRSLSAFFPLHGRALGVDAGEAGLVVVNQP